MQDIRWAPPERFVGQEGREEFHTSDHAPSVGELELHEVFLGRGEHDGQTGHDIEVEDRVAVGLGARQLAREAAVGRHLSGQHDFFEAAAAVGERRLVIEQQGKGGGLEQPAGSVVVVGLAFLDAVGMGLQPVQVVAKPILHRDLGRGIKCFGAVQGANPQRHFGQMHGVDQASGAARAHALDRLRILEVGVHPGRGIDQPDAQLAHGRLGETLVVRQIVSGGERADVAGKSKQQPAVREKIRGIRFTIAADVGAVGVRRVRPPIVALGGEIMRATGAAGIGDGGDGDRLGAERCFRERDDARKLLGGEAEAEQGGGEEHGENYAAGVESPHQFFAASGCAPRQPLRHWAISCS